MPRGGKREGAGRPPKRGWWDELVIGQTCEVLWREAVKEAFGERKKRKFSEESELQTLWDSFKAIPVSQRSAWLRSEGYEDHKGDVEAWLHKLGATDFNEATGSYKGKAPRGITLSTKPPKGTRARIIAEVAHRYGISTDTANRLWKAYRRFECDQADR